MKRYEAIQQQAGAVPVSRLCEILRVSRSGYYAWCGREPSQRRQDDAVLTDVISNIFHDNRCCYGSPRIHAALRQAGYRVGRKRVARLMRQAGLRPRRRKRYVPRTTVANPEHPVFENHLDRGFEAQYPDEKWMVDITYIDTHEGWLYLAGVMDLYSRRIVGMAMADRMTTDLVNTALNMAVVERQPQPGLLHHSDRGSQYTSGDYQQRLKDLQMQVSMSRPAQCLDAAPIESFWGTLKTECVTYRFDSHEQACTEIFSYVMGFYNRTRLHSALDYQSPHQYEQQVVRLSHCL
jgi:transposase InsO family protein